MKHAEKLAEAVAERKQAERDLLESKIRLAVVSDKIAASERAEARRQRVLVQTAVERLVKAGMIREDDDAAQFDMTAQLLSDPSLIPLALTRRIYRAGPAAKR